MVRLTLRYLLAYLDDQLEPADAQAMSQLIEASPFATDLMHRVHDVSRRLKLTAPRLKARGLAGDANTVAEYLDHTMPADQVVELEKKCLTSDVHLAEVASAHQILALVLRERADVDVALRRRMYGLQDRAAELDEQHEDEESAVDHRDGEEPVVVETTSARRRPEIPEWLREQPKRPNRWVIPLAAAALLVGAGISAYLYFTYSADTTNVASADSPRAEPRDSLGNAPLSGASVATTPVEPPAPQAADDSAQKSDDPSSADDGATSPVAEDLSATGAAEADTADPGREPQVSTSAPGEREIAQPSTDDSPPRMPESHPLRNPAAEPGFETDVPGSGASAPATDGGLPSALGDQALVPGGVPDAEGAVAPVSVGRLISDNEILLHAAAPEAAWRRLSMRDALAADDELISLPTFRPGIAFSSGGGAIVHVLGGSVVRLLAPDDEDVPGLQIIDGQVVVSTSGKPGTLLSLQVGEQTYLMTFVGPDARIAIDARRVFPDGAEPLEEHVTTVADLYVPSGEVQYATAGAAPESVKAPAIRQLVTNVGAVGDEASTEVTFPTWINGNPLSPSERLAQSVAARELAPDEPVQVRLRELAEDRRVEVRNLAVQCLTLLGDFDSLLPLLDDEKQRINWSHQIEAARGALARDPAMVKRLKETFETQRDPKKAKDLFEMVRGYSRRQLQDGAAARLVADLDAEDLAVRVLAFWNLQRTSVGSQNYHPEYPTAKRREGVRAWQKKLTEGHIVPKSSG